MIDLHTHTNYSDGTWSLKTLLEEAEKANIEVLSITDHDTVNSYKELEKINVKEIFKGNIIKIANCIKTVCYFPFTYSKKSSVHTTY